MQINYRLFLSLLLALQLSFAGAVLSHAHMSGELAGSGADGAASIKTVTSADASKYGLQKSSGSNILYDAATGINYAVGKDGLFYEVSSLSGFNTIPMSKPLTSATNRLPTSGFGPICRTVDDSNLDAMLDSNYGTETINGARVGNGGTADALRYENATGELLSASGHRQKAEELRTRLQSYVRRATNSPNPNSAGTTFTQRDIDYANEIIADLNNALEN